MVYIDRCIVYVPVCQSGQKENSDAKKQGNSLVLVVALEFQDYPIPPSHQATTQPNCVNISETTKPKMAKSRKSRYKNIKNKPKESNQKKQENINGLL